MPIINQDCLICGKPKVFGYCRNANCKEYTEYSNDLEEALGRISERDIEFLRSWRKNIKASEVFAEKMLTIAKAIKKGK